MTARETAEEWLDTEASPMMGVGWALLDLADAVRESRRPVVDIGAGFSVEVLDEENGNPTRVRLRTPMGDATVPQSSQRGTLETAWGPATVEGFRDRTIDGGGQRGEPGPRRIVHWDAGGDDSLACGQGSGYSTRVPGDVTCRACSRIADLVAERDEARLLIRQVESQLDQWVVDNDWLTRPDPVVRLEPLVGQLRTLYRVRGVEVARLPLIEVES